LLKQKTGPVYMATMYVISQCYRYVTCA